jgi:hypothetical protein
MSLKQSLRTRQQNLMGNMSKIIIAPKSFYPEQTLHELRVQQKI